MTSQADQDSEKVDQGPQIQRVQLIGIPALWQLAASLLGTAFLIIGSLITAGGWYLNKSLEGTELRLNKSIDNAVKPVMEKQGEFKTMLSLMISMDKDLAENESNKQLINSLLLKLRHEDVKSVLKEQPPSAKRQPLNRLTDSKQVEQVGKTVELKWDGGKPAQVRFMKQNTPDFDFSKIDLYTDDDDPCNSRIFNMEDYPNITVQVCETHLDSGERKLEFIIMTNPYISTTGEASDSAH